MHRWMLMLVATVTFGCAGGETWPAYGPLQADYEAPTAKLDQDAMEAVWNDLLSLFVEHCYLGTVPGLEQARRPLAVDAEVTRDCPKGGKITIETTGTDGEIIEKVRATADNCAYLLPSVKAMDIVQTFDGTAYVYSYADGSRLWVIEGTMTVGQDVTTVTFNFLVSQSKVSFLLLVGESHLIATVAPGATIEAALQTFDVSAVNGQFTCTFDHEAMTITCNDNAAGTTFVADVAR